MGGTVDEMTVRALHEDRIGREMRAAVAAEGHVSAMPPSKAVAWGIEADPKPSRTRRAREIRADIRKLRAAGMTDRDIAAKVGLTCGRVTQIRREMGVE